MSRVFIYTATKENEQENVSTFWYSGSLWREGMETEGGWSGDALPLLSLSPCSRGKASLYCGVYNILFVVTTLNLA